MNTREIATEYRLSHWAQIMQDRNTSGMSIKEYCKTAGIGSNVYFYWQRKLREAACNELLSKPNNTTNDSQNGLVPSGWAVCTANEPSNRSKTLVLEINGCRISVDSDTDPELLSKTCRVLMSL